MNYCNKLILMIRLIFEMCLFVNKKYIKRKVNCQQICYFFYNFVFVIFKDN